MALAEGEKYGGSRKGKDGAIRRAVLGPRGKILRWETVETSTTAASSAPETPAATPAAPAKPKRTTPTPKADAPPAQTPAPRAVSVDQIAKWAKVAAGAAALFVIGWGLSRLTRRA